MRPIKSAVGTGKSIARWGFRGVREKEMKLMAENNPEENGKGQGLRLFELSNRVLSNSDTFDPVLRRVNGVEKCCFISDINSRARVFPGKIGFANDCGNGVDDVWSQNWSNPKRRR